MVKLADALDSGSSGSDSVQVQVLSLAPSFGNKKDIANKNLGFTGVFAIYCTGKPADCPRIKKGLSNLACVVQNREYVKRRQKKERAGRYVLPARSV